MNLSLSAGDGKPVLHAQDNLDVLLLPSSPAEGRLCRDVLRTIRVKSRICRSVDQLLAYLRAGCGPLVIAAERLTPDATHRLLECLQEEPEWSDPPLIIIVRDEIVPEGIRPLIDKRKTSLLHRPIKVADFATAIRAAVENRRRQYLTRMLIRRMREQASQLQRLWLQLIDTEERERQRLAELLHDDLQQILVAANYRLGMLAGQASEGPLARMAAGLSSMLDEAIAKSRQMSRELYPPVLQGQHGIGDALRWLAERMGDLHGLQVDLDVRIQDEAPVSSQQKVFLYRCAQEFLFNVIKHAKTLRAVLRLARMGANLELSVKDEGCGFSSEKAAPAEQTTGLGLVGIRERARALGGRLQIVSESGRGTNIVLSVPEEVDGGQSKPSSAREAVSPSPPQPPIVSGLGAPHDTVDDSTMRVLLADDHKVMRSGLRALLEERRNVQVVAEAGNGVEAVRLARQLQPEVIVMDVAMPRMGGIEATRRIKDRHPHIRIIGLTMFDDSETRQKMLGAGADRCLTKSAPGSVVVDAVLHSSPRAASADSGSPTPKSLPGVRRTRQ